MNHRLLTSLVALVLVSSAACRTTTEQSKATNAQRTADNEIAVADAERAEKNRVSQDEANVKITEAQTAFTKMRNDYRHSTSLALADLDLDIAGLEAKQKKLKGKSKADLDASLINIHSARERYTAAHASLEATTATTWDQAKKELDAQWDVLKDLVDKS